MKVLSKLLAATSVGKGSVADVASVATRQTENLGVAELAPVLVAQVVERQLVP